MRIPVILILVIATGVSYAQTQPPAPVEEARPRQDTLQRDQLKAGTAYRELRQAEFAARQAQEDFRQADAAHKAAQKHADDLKRAADAEKKKLDEAKAKEAQARKLYDAAVDTTDRDSRGAAPGK